MRARVTSKGQVTVPKTVRDRLGVQAGDELDFVFSGETLEVRPIRRPSIQEFFGAFRPETPTNLTWEEQRRIAWDAETARLRAEGNEPVG